MKPYFFFFGRKRKIKFARLLGFFFKACSGSWEYSDRRFIEHLSNLDICGIAFLFKHQYPENILKLDHTKLQVLYRFLLIFHVSKCFTSQSILNSCFNNLPIRTAWVGARMTREPGYISILRIALKTPKNGSSIHGIKNLCWHL